MLGLLKRAFAVYDWLSGYSLNRLLPAVVDHTVIVEPQASGRRDDAAAAIAVGIHVLQNRHERLDLNVLRPAQIHRPRRMNVKLKQHRRRRRHFKDDFVTALDEHE